MTEREKLIELLCNNFMAITTSYLEEVADRLIDNGVTIPVRCGECELCNDFGHEGWCKRFDTRVGTDGYCHYGERRADNG